LVVLAQTIFVRGRAYHMFAFLFGYGIVQLLRRHVSGGVDVIVVRKLIHKRGWWMILFGFVHAALLFSGDIIGAYGLLAVLLARVLVQARDRTLLIISALWVVPIVLFRIFENRLSPLHEKAVSSSAPLHAAELRILEWVQGSVIGSVFLLVPAVMLGVWAARRRLLDDPELHRLFLSATAADCSAAKCSVSSSYC
ncbi:MAG: hypothetical protein ACRDSH_22460, partial [Pseudonocardiaceae bacterium]